MGHAIDALEPGVRNVVENPKVLAVAYALAVALLPVGIAFALVAVVLAFVPIVGQLLTRAIAAAVLKPLFVGGLLGVAGAGFAGGAGFGDYLETIKGKGITLAGMYLIYEAFVLAIGVALVVIVIFTVGMGTLVGATSDPGAAAGGLAGASVLVAVGAYLVAGLVVVAVAVVFQFSDAAVVLGDYGAVDAYRDSWQIVRDAPVSVLGYTVLRVLLGTAVVLPGLLLAGVGAQLSDLLAFAGVGLAALLSPAAFALVLSYHAAYYGYRVRAR